jgi:transcription-repair coupling factor (superfamily II helicase)
MKLLDETIKELKGEEIEDDLRAAVNLRVDLRVDESYIPDVNQRLTVYRRMAAVRSEADLDRHMDEVRDRYGPLPDSVLNLAEYAAIRLMADRLRVESLDRDGHAVVLKFRPDAKLDPAWLFRVIQARGDVVLLPPATLKLDLRGPEKQVEKRVVVPPRSGAQRPRKGGDPVAGGSWWAARAKGGEVAPGFSRDEILRPAKEDPRAEGGLFVRVSSFLRELSSGGSIS